MVTSVLAVTASAWGVLMGISPVLQIRRMLRERSSREVSLGYYVILLAGFLLWISYGIAAQNLVLIIPNTIALLVGLTLVAVALRLRRSLGGPHRDQAHPARRHRDRIAAPDHTQRAPGPQVGNPHRRADPQSLQRHPQWNGVAGGRKRWARKGGESSE